MEKYLKYIPLTGSFFALIGILNIFIYYGTFGINIFPFLTATDLIYSFAYASIPLFFPIIPFVIFLFLTKKLQRDQEPDNEPVDYSPKHPKPFYLSLPPIKKNNFINRTKRFFYILTHSKNDTFWKFMFVSTIIAPLIYMFNLFDFYFSESWELLFSNSIPKTLFKKELFGYQIDMSMAFGYNLYFSIMLFMGFTLFSMLILILFRKAYDTNRFFFNIPFFLILSVIVIEARMKTIGILRLQDQDNMEAIIELEKNIIHTNECLIFVGSISNFIILYNVDSKSSIFIPHRLIKSFTITKEDILSNEMKEHFISPKDTIQ